MINDIVYILRTVTKHEDMTMLDSVNRTDVSLISLGTVLHSAALMSQAAIDAIPENAVVNDEMNVIELAIAPVDALAQLILRMPCKNDAGRAVRSRAQAWMDGHYWRAAEIAA